MLRGVDLDGGVGLFIFILIVCTGGVVFGLERFNIFTIEDKSAAG